MAKDPAFLFYPGDYLRDTQCLSEKAQVAYDRIMCEHMRNICISQQQLNFFTKRLSDDEKSELMFTLTEKDGGYQIEWVAESIMNRRKYSDNRRKNRLGKKNNISSTYDNHMENENVIENKKRNKKIFTKPTIEEFVSYFLENGFNKELALKAYNHYDLADWHDTKGNKVKNWKQKVHTNWFNNNDKHKPIQQNKTIFEQDIPLIR